MYTYRTLVLPIKQSNIPPARDNCRKNVHAILVLSKQKQVIMLVAHNTMYDDSKPTSPETQTLLLSLIFQFLSRNVVPVSVLFRYFTVEPTKSIECFFPQPQACAVECYRSRCAISMLSLSTRWGACVFCQVTLSSKSLSTRLESSIQASFHY